MVKWRWAAMSHCQEGEPKPEDWRAIYLAGIGPDWSPAAVLKIARDYLGIRGYYPEYYGPEEQRRWLENLRAVPYGPGTDSDRLYPRATDHGIYEYRAAIAREEAGGDG